MGKKFLILIVLLLLSCRSEVREDSISIGLMGELITLDPFMRSEAITYSVNSNIFESLVKFDSNMAVQPSLATSWDNPDTLSWIFHLRDGVLFHNGDTLSVGDVKFSLLRARDHPSSELRGRLLKVKSVDIIGKNTIKIITIKPDFPLLNKLVSVPILSKKYTESEDLKYLSSHPVGTGPYRFLEWNKSKYVKLTRNQHYWGQLPKIRDITFIFYTNLDTAIEDLLSGRTSILDNFPCDKIEKIKKNKDVELVYIPGFSVTYFGFNMNSPIFRKRKVRWAIYYGLNRKELIDSVRMGYAEEATQLLNPRVYGYNPKISLIPYDTIKAKELLQEAGYAGGFKIRFLFFGARKKLGGMIKRDLEKIGIDVTLVPLPAGELFEEIGKGDFDAFSASFISTSGDAEQGLCETIHSRDRKRGYGLLNHGRFSNEKIDRMIESLETLGSPNERLRMMQKILANVMDEVPSIPLFVSDNLYAKRKNIAWKPRMDRTILVSEISKEHKRR